MIRIEIQDTTHIYCKIVSMCCPACNKRNSMTKHQFSFTPVPLLCTHCSSILYNMNELASTITARLFYHKGKS